jgi:hypothetical protein
MRLDYDEISPICGEKTVFCEYDDRLGVIRLCMKTGYQNSEIWDDPEELERFKASCPPMVLESEFIATDNRHWYRITVAQGGMFLYFCDNEWHLANVVEQELNSPFGIMQGEKSYVVDHDNSVRYAPDDFELALINFNSVVIGLDDSLNN